MHLTSLPVLIEGTPLPTCNRMILWDRQQVVLADLRGRRRLATQERAPAPPRTSPAYMAGKVQLEDVQAESVALNKYCHRSIKFTKLKLCVGHWSYKVVHCDS